MLERMSRKRNPYLLVGVQIHRTVMETCLEGPQNILNSTNMSQLFCSWYIPRKPHVLTPVICILLI